MFAGALVVDVGESGFRVSPLEGLSLSPVSFCCASTRSGGSLLSQLLLLHLRKQQQQQQQRMHLALGQGGGVLTQWIGEI